MNIICKKCKTEKNTDEFYESKNWTSGYDSSCKQCRRDQIRENRRAKSDYYKQYEKRRSHRPERREYVREIQNTDVFKKKHCVHGKVCTALENGKLTKPDRCETCNREGRLVAHHCDYLKPMEVDWLCYSCHGIWHANNEALNR